MRTTRSFASVGIATAATLAVLAACSSGPAPQDPADTTAGPSEPATEEAPARSDVHLRMTMWTSNPDQLALFQSIADDFMAQYPAVTDIAFESLTLDQLDTVLTTGIQAGSPPDLSWLPVESSLEYLQAGALVDLAPTLRAAEGYDFDDLVPGLQERWRAGDAQYGVPFSTGPLVTYYNKDLYAQAGVKSPEDLIAEGSWTWEAFRETSKQVTDAVGVPGYVVNDFDYKNWTRLLPILFAYGAAPWDAEATTCTADAPEFVEAVSLFHGMVFEDGSSPVPGQQADFWGGQAAATTAFLSSNALLADATFEWGLVPTPAGPAGDVQALGQAAIVVLAAGENQREATDFLAYLTNAENATKLAQFWPPARASLLEPDVLVGSSTILTEELVEPIVEASKTTGTIFPVAVDNSAVANALNGALDEFVWAPGVDLEEALGQVCGAIQPLL